MLVKLLSERQRMDALLLKLHPLIVRLPNVLPGCQDPCSPLLQHDTISSLHSRKGLAKPTLSVTLELYVVWDASCIGHGRMRTKIAAHYVPQRDLRPWIHHFWQAAASDVHDMRQSCLRVISYSAQERSMLSSSIVSAIIHAYAVRLSVPAVCST